MARLPKMVRLTAKLPLARIATATALIAILLPVIMWGGLLFQGLLLFLAALCAGEWARLAGGSWRSSLLLALAICGALALDWGGWPRAGILWLAVSGGLLAAAGGACGNPGRGWIMAAGAGYIFLAAAALAAIRGTATGLFDTLWLIAMVAATDTGAQMAGKLLGGPRLAPVISPNKTWSGLAGGMICAALAALGFSLATQGASPLVYALTGLATGAIAQLGDLLESALKRRAGVKDSGRLLPGHGGLLDRVDGLLAAAPCFALLLWYGV